MKKRDYARAVERYIDGVLSGSIPAGELVRLACHRHLKDQRELRPNFIYDQHAANRACAFIELHYHTKGVWASRKERFRMSDWQVFKTCMLFGWRRKDGKRRFREAYIQVPRKNGKSIWAAAVGLYMFVEDGEHGAEVYSGATSERQAWEVFGVARNMALMNDEFRDYYGVDVLARTIVNLSTGSKFAPVVRDPGDGSSPHCAIIDEYHEHKDPRLYDTMVTGTGSRAMSPTGPLVLVITTAGTDTGGPCYERYTHAKNVLAGLAHDPELFALVYGIDEDDDWTDPAALKKANPNIGVSIDRDFLLREQQKAKDNPAKANIFRIKHLNQWVNAKSTWLNLYQFSQCRLPDAAKVEDYEHLPAVLAWDFSSRCDICAGMLVFSDVIDGKRHYYAFPRFFLPSDTVDYDATGRYGAWRSSGELETTDGAELDYDILLDDIRKTIEAHDVREFVFDPWRTNYLAQQLINDGANVVEFRNTPRNLTEAMREAEAAIASGRFHYKRSAILEWMASNAIKRDLPNEMTTIDKERPDRKIDGISALLMATARAMYFDTTKQFKSVYEYTSL